MGQFLGGIPPTRSLPDVLPRQVMCHAHVGHWNQQREIVDGGCFGCRKNHGGRFPRWHFRLWQRGGFTAGAAALAEMSGE